jgi:hypothetical protein
MAVKIIDLSQMVKMPDDEAVILLWFGEHDPASHRTTIKYQIKG